MTRIIVDLITSFLVYLEQEIDMPEHDLSERLRKVLLELEQVLLELDKEENCDNLPS